MQWIAPSEKDPDNAALEKRLWDAANQLWAGAGLKQSEYSEPVLGLIFLRFAEVRFSAQRAKLELPSTSGRGAGGEGDAHDRANTVLFIDARHVYRQVDRAHREWTPAQIGFMSNIVRLYRGEEPDFTLGGDGGKAKIQEIFGCRGGVSPSQKSGKKSPTVTDCRYKDIPGLCRAATIKEIEAQGWSLNPGRYVGVAPGEAVSDEDFKEQLETMNEELESLNAAARELEATIAANVTEILET